MTVQLYVLLNCDAIKPYLNNFEQYHRLLNPHFNDADIDKLVEAHFVSWLKTLVHTQPHIFNDSNVRDLAWGPFREVETWPIYFVNGYKFHTDDWSIGKKTINSGVCVKVTGEGGGENDYFGILKQVVQLQYFGEPTKKIILFHCDWFDPMSNRGTRVHSDYGIIEIKHTRRYGKFDPFIFAHQAIQVYFVPYPIRTREKSEWWVVIKTRPRGLVENEESLQLPYQEEQPHIISVSSDLLNENLTEEGQYVEINYAEEQDEEDEEEEEDQEEEEEEESEDEDEDIDLNEEQDEADDNSESDN